MPRFDIDKFVDSNDYIEHRSNEREMVFECPRCEDGDPDGHMYVNRRTHKFFCHRCNFAGRPLQEYDDNIKLSPPALSEIQLPPSYIPLMPQSKELFHSLIRQQPLIRKMLKNKKFRWEDLQGWDIGYCSNGPYSGRLIVPVYHRDKVVAFQGRNLESVGPKYKNRQAVSVFAQVFYNWDRAARFDHLVVVEGPFDAWRVGFNAIATMGTYLSEWRVDLINSLHPKRVTFLFDGDKAGINNAYKSSKKIFPTIEVRSVLLPSKKDPAEISHEVLLDLIEDAKKSSLSNLFID